MIYDCHVEPRSQTPPSHLGRYLKDTGRRGAVLIEDGASATARHALLAHLASVACARGVIHLRGETWDELVRLDTAGVCGTWIDISDRGNPWDHIEQIEQLHESTLRHWHIELAVEVPLAARLAPLLARMDRTFCLSLRQGRTPSTRHDEDRLKWWIDMGNVYVKYVAGWRGVSPEGWLANSAAVSPDRVVIGTGWPQLPCSHSSPFDNPGAQDELDSNAERLYCFPVLARREVN